MVSDKNNLINPFNKLTFIGSAFIISSTSLRRTLRGFIISSALLAAHLYLILGPSPQRFRGTAKDKEASILLFVGLVGLAALAPFTHIVFYSTGKAVNQFLMSYAGNEILLFFFL